MKNSPIYSHKLFFLKFLCYLQCFFFQVAVSQDPVEIHDKLKSIAFMHFNFHKRPEFQLNRDTALSSIRQLRVSQGFGDPLYKKFSPSSLLRFYGFTGYGFGTITRQPVLATNIASYLFPAQFLPDVIGRDINAHAQSTMDSIGARLGMLFNPIAQRTENNIFGLLEFDFSGVSPITVYIAKIRHGFGEIIWKTGNFLFGQYFHPLFLPDCFPRVVNYNQGAPFEPQGLFAQARVSQFWNNFEFIVAAASEAYIQSWGPDVLATLPATMSLNFINDAIVPNWHFQLRWVFDENKGYVGGAIDYKRLVPRLVSFNNYKVNEHIDSLIGEVFSHNIFKWGEINFKIVYAQNGADQLLISGYAVKTVDPVTDFRTYANTAAIATWLDIFSVFFHESMSVGLFAGATVNLGASSALFIDPTTGQPVVYALDALTQNISYVARISPRYSYSLGAFRLGFELSWDTIAYGNLDNHARVICAIPVGAFSYSISMDYVF